MSREWKPSEADKRRADVYDVTMDGHLAAGAVVPQAHALALQAVIDKELHAARVAQEEVGDAWPFDQ